MARAPSAWTPDSASQRSQIAARICFAAERGVDGSHRHARLARHLLDAAGGVAAAAEHPPRRGRDPPLGLQRLLLPV
jgi:hypothetical protein